LKRQNPLPGLTIDRSSPTPLHRQLADALRLAIRTGGLRGGAALPSTRGLAAALGVPQGPAGPDWRTILRGAQYPARTFAFEDPDGHPLYGNDSR
jgi:hypothetical protein